MKQFVFIAIILIVIAAAFYFFSNKFTQRSPEIPLIRPLWSFITHSSPGDLKTTIDKSLAGSKGVYGIAVKNLKTGEEYFLKEHLTFDSGSLYKLWILATAYNQIEEGQLSEDEILSQEISKLNEEFNIASKDAEMTEGEIILTTKQALTQMITISHNYASLLLTEKIKISNVKAFLEKNNLNESITGEPPKTTAYDTALFLEKLYKGDLANHENTQKMLNILKSQTLNDKLPKYLPQETTVAHKTGEINFFTHDAGIIFTSKGDYIIVIMSESDFPPGAQERIALVSKAVFDYFINK